MRMQMLIIRLTAHRADEHDSDPLQITLFHTRSHGRIHILKSDTTTHPAPQFRPIHVTPLTLMKNWGCRHPIYLDGSAYAQRRFQYSECGATLGPQI